MTRRRINRLVIHWSDSGQSTTVEDIRRWHTAKGWRDIGYHRVILHPLSAEYIPIGKTKRPTAWWELVKTGRSLNNDLFLDGNEVGAHCLGYNSTSVGICVISKPGQPLHPLQREALIQTIKTLLARFQLPVSALYGHRELYPTACPGDEIFQIITRIREGRL